MPALAAAVLAANRPLFAKGVAGRAASAAASAGLERNALRLAVVFAAAKRATALSSTSARHASAGASLRPLHSGLAALPTGLPVFLEPAQGAGVLDSVYAPVTQAFRLPPLGTLCSLKTQESHANPWL
mmetsp:Transcript_67103/g.143583  ORF Transcript_67103/g.143583 Transcript_67103/m.143583 type:complete len:128 (+) Transcript_67103:57-440(+)